MTERPTFLKSNTASASISEWVEKGNTVKESFEDYKVAIAQTIECNMKLLDELPPLKSLSIEEIKAHLQKKIEENLKDDEEFEKAVEIYRYTRSLNNHLKSYFSEIFKHHENLKNRMNSDIFEICRLYFNSDLPLSFLKIMEASILTQRDYLDIFDRQISKEQIKLLTYRSNRPKFIKLCEQHNKWIAPFNKRLDKIESLQVKIIWYVDFSNCQTVNDLFKTKAIQSSNLDLTALKKLMDELDKLIKETEALIEPKLEFTPLVSYGDSNSARAIRKIVELLQEPQI